MEFVRKNMDGYNNVMGIFLDVQKHFQCADRKLIVIKLEYAGIRGISNS